MRRGPLVIYSQDNGICRAFRNIPGIKAIYKHFDVITPWTVYQLIMYYQRVGNLSCFFGLEITSENDEMPLVRVSEYL